MYEDKWFVANHGVIQTPNDEQVSRDIGAGKSFYSGFVNVLPGPGNECVGVSDPSLCEFAVRAIAVAVQEAKDRIGSVSVVEIAIKRWSDLRTVTFKMVSND